MSLLSTPFVSITQGIRVSVFPKFLPEYSTPAKQHFVFSYQVLLENQSDAAVKLLKRRWHVIDGLGENQFVEGAGVVGEQPVLAPQGAFDYTSGVQLQSQMGKMYGNYIMQRLSDEVRFSIKIPEFILVTPDRMQ
ncbi:MAG: Co2+/Mg2+ efflux protein ApaG [Bacteroidota bacterium]